MKRSLPVRALLLLFVPESVMAKATKQQKLGGFEDRAEDADPFEPFLTYHKTFRIAATGDVMVTRVECEIIDTPEFQRLRGIRQLGQVYLVYPTALHTRFDHSLGTMAMAQRMIDAIVSNTHSKADEKRIGSRQRILIRLYALLHDITHIPFGHTIEDELSLFTRHDDNDERIQHFLGPDSTIGRKIVAALGRTMLDQLLAIYQYNDKDEEAANDGVDNDDVFIYDLVSNTVCADLLDYLQRDNYFCNLGIGLEYRFLNFLYLYPDQKGRRRVFVRLWKTDKKTPRRDTLTDLARLLEARYLVAERAYFHHTKLIGGAMVGRALQEAGITDESELYDASDDSVLRQLKNSDGVAGMLGQRLAERHLHKTLHVFRSDAFRRVQESDAGVNFRDRAHKQVNDPKRRKELEDRLADEIGLPRGTVLLYSPDPRMNLKVAKMKVWWKGSAIAFEQIDDEIIHPRLQQILDAHRKLWGIHVFVDESLTEDERALVRDALDVEFILDDRERERKRREYYEKIFERSLDGAVEYEVPRADSVYRDLKRKAAEALEAWTNKRSGDETFAQRLAAVQAQFLKKRHGDGGSSET
jgi:HD superfamily phosphohydrolase